MSAPDDDFTKDVKQRILDAYVFESDAELNAAIEERMPGYLAAHAEWEAEKAAFTAELQDRWEEARQAVAAFLRGRGVLPDGVELEVVPMDLQADPKWMAQVPEWWAKGEPIVVDYATDQPLVPLVPDAPVLTEGQKRAAVEAASAQIERRR